MSTENEVEISGLGTPAGFVDTLGREPDVLGILDGMPASVDGLGVTVFGTASARNSTLSTVRIDTIMAAPVLVFAASFTPPRAAAAVQATAVQQPAPVAQPQDTAAPAAPAIDDLAPLSNVATLVLRGTAEAGSTVWVAVDGAPAGSAVAQGNGSWSLGLVLTDGAHSITSTAEDAAGNISAISLPVQITVDTGAPSVPEIVSLTGETGTDRPTLSGSAEPGSTITVYLDGAVIGTATAGEAGAWSFTPVSAIADGNHVVSATATDLAGNVSSASGEFDFLVDRTGPAAAVVTGISTDGASSGGVTNVNTLSFRGASEAGSSVELFVNGVSIGSAVSDATGFWEFDNSGTELADGSYAVTARAKDAAGNIGPMSESYTVVVDTVSPDAAVITSISGGNPLPTAAIASFNEAPGIAGSGGTLVSGKAITGDNTLIITGTAEQGSSVEVFIDGVLVGTAVTNAAGTWQFDHSGTVLGDGTYTITARAIDAAGNIGPISAGFEATIDTVAPSAALVTGISGDTGVPGDGITNDKTLVISGQSEAFSSVEVFLSGKSAGTVTADASGAWALDRTSTVMADGRYAVTARATDAAGNVGALSPEYSLTIDSSAPRPATISGISTDTGIPTDRITSDNTLIINGRAERDATVEVYLNGALAGTSVADAAGLWTLDHTATPLANGTYTITARVVDVAGNLGTLSAGLAFTVDASTPPAPAITGISGDSAAAGDGITNDRTLIISGTAEKDSTVEVFLDGVSVGTAVANASGAWSLDRTAQALADDRYEVTARATDKAGNIGVLSAPYALTIDAQAPNAAVVTGVSGDTANPADGITGDNTLVISGTAEAGSSVEVFLNGVSAGSVKADTSGHWSLDNSGTALADGTYAVTAHATDAAGNAGTLSAPYALTVDTTAPAPAVVTGIAGDTGVPGDGVTSDNTLTFNGTAEANSSVEVFLNGGLAGIVSANASGLWTLDLTAHSLPNGDYTIAARATDVAGNVGPMSADYAFTVDAVVPTAPVVTGLSTDTAVAGDGVTSDRSIVISGLAERASAVEVYLNSQKIGSTVADALGGWSFDHTGVSLPDGTYAVTARATDAAGNASAFSAPFTLTVDGTAPAAPSIDPLPIITDSGSILLSGVAAGGSAVAVFVDGVKVDTVTASPNGNWSLQVTVPEGEHQVTATATDLAGNGSVSSSAAGFTVDLTRPTQADWLDGGTVAENADVGTVVGMVAAQDDRATVVTYELLDSAGGRFAIDAATGVVTVRSNSLTVTPPETLDWDQGHAITVRATDAAGNSETSTLRVGVDNPETPEYRSEIAFIDGGLSDAAILASGIRPGVEVHVVPAGTDGLDFIASVLAGRQGVDAIHILSHGEAGAVQIGNYTLDASNLGSRSGVLTTIGNALAAGGDILLYGCDTASDGGILLSALASATGADVAGSMDLTGSNLLGGDWRLESSTGPIEAGGAVTSEGRAAYAGTLPGTTLQAGDIAIIQMSSDGYDDFIRFVPLVDLAAGTVVKFSDRSLLTGGTFSGDAAEGNETWVLSAPISAGTILFFDPYYGVTDTFAGNNIAQGINSWDTGLDVISLQGENFFIYTGGSGNLFDTSLSGFIWGVNAPGTSDPMNPDGWAASNLETTNSILPTGLNPGVNAMSMYDGGVEARNNFNYTGPTSATDKAGWAARFANPANFTHSDGVAPGSTISGSITVTASLPKTATPTITLDPSSDTGSSNSDRETSASSVILMGTAEANSTVTVSMGGVVQGTATANGSGNWSYTTSAGTPLSDGVKSFTATATGTSGVASDPTTALLVTIDRTAPIAPTLSLDVASDTGASNSDRIINDNTPTIRGTAEALSTVAILSNGTKIGETTADGSGNWSFTTPVLGDGSRSLEAQATDKAGNTSSFSPALALTVDTVVNAPILTSTSNTGTPPCQ